MPSVGRCSRFGPGPICIPAQPAQPVQPVQCLDSEKLGTSRLAGTSGLSVLKLRPTPPSFRRDKDSTTDSPRRDQLPFFPPPSPIPSPSPSVLFLRLNTNLLVARITPWPLPQTSTPSSRRSVCFSESSVACAHAHADPLPQQPDGLQPRHPRRPSSPRPRSIPLRRAFRQASLAQCPLPPRPRCLVATTSPLPHTLAALTSAPSSP